MPRIFEYKTEAVDNLFSDHTIYENREKMARFSTKEFKSDVTISVAMYKDLPKIKRCVDSIMKYSDGIDYDLMFLIDGSQEGIFDYFKDFDYEKTTIIYNTANRGGGIPWGFVNINMLSEYLVTVAGDVVVTRNWLSNMMNCINSDPTIGLVVPMSSNVSNYQGYDLGGFNDYDEMQEKAARFNISDPRKWEERLRIINIVQLIKKSAIYALGIPFSDAGFAHNFSDDDLSFRLRRMGYKTVLAGDTWIHHDHPQVRSSIEEVNAFNQNIALGRADFKSKYYGIDAWDDVNNFLSYKDSIENTSSEIPQILGIDVKCGTPILDVKNKIRQYNKLTTECFAITSDPKYYVDLQSFCGAENVLCGDATHLLNKFISGSLDYIVIDKPINTYPNPFEIISNCAAVLKNDGHIYVRLRNTLDIFSYMNMLGYVREYETEYALNYSFDQFVKKIRDMGGAVKAIYEERYFPQEINAMIPVAEKNLNLTLCKSGNPQESADRLMTKYWAFDITLT